MFIKLKDIYTQMKEVIFHEYFVKIFSKYSKKNLSVQTNICINKKNLLLEDFIFKKNHTMKIKLYLVSMVRPWIS